jgi:uncharacterized delta-60 repeat protein
MPEATAIVWTRYLGTSSSELACSMTTGLDGSIFVSGITNGSLDGQNNNGGWDVFVTKYTPDGTKAWTRLLGTSSNDEAYGLTTDLEGSIYVSGYTGGSLDGQTNSGDTDAFVTKFKADGTKVWTSLLGTSIFDSARALTTGLDGSIYVSGDTYGSMDGQINNGGYDVFIAKFNPNGTKVWTRLLGSSQNDIAQDLCTGLDGSIYVSGETNGSLDGLTNNASYDIFISKYNPDGTRVWTRLLGISSSSGKYALTSGLDGSIYICGSTYDSPDGQTNSGEQDVFITKYNPDGTKVWTRLLGTSQFDKAAALTIGLDGTIFISGYTFGSLDGQINSGNSDAFVTQYNPDGTKVWTRLLGTSQSDEVNALTIGLDGAIYLSGFTYGSLGGQINSGDRDAFIVKLEPPDTTAPTIAITSNKAALSAGETAVITFTLSEIATDFALSDISVSGGALSNFSGSGVSYSVTFTPTASSTTPGSVRVANNKFSDAAGNSNADEADTNNLVSFSINTIPPTYGLNTQSASVDEGSSVTFTLTTSNLATGTFVPYTLSGVSSSDVSGGLLSGNAVVNSSGLATISVTLVNDVLNEGAETLTITAGGATASTVINDTSITAFLNPTTQMRIPAIVTTQFDRS